MKQRPHITLVDGKVCHETLRGKVSEPTVIKLSMSKGLICVGCSYITPEAMKFIYNKYVQLFESNAQFENIIQEGFDGGCND